MPPSHLARVILLEFPPPLNSGLESSAPVFCPVIKPVSQSPHPRPLWLALTTGLVAAFFSVLYQAIEEFLHLAPNQQFKELIVITVTSVGMLLAIEPILERIGPVREHHAFGHEDDILIRAGALLTIVATAFLHGLLHAHLSESLSAHGMVVLEQLLTALVAPTLITLSWIHGMRRERARWYGLSVGVLTGLGLVMFAMVQLYFLRPSAGLRDVPLRNAIRALLAVATSFLGFIVPTCAVNGFLGGLAIDRQWSAKAWSGIALRIADRRRGRGRIVCSGFIVRGSRDPDCRAGPAQLDALAGRRSRDCKYRLGNGDLGSARCGRSASRHGTIGNRARDEMGTRHGRHLCGLDARPGIVDIAGYHRARQSGYRGPAWPVPLTLLSADTIAFGHAGMDFPRQRGMSIPRDCSRRPSWGKFWVIGGGGSASIASHTDILKRSR